MKTMQRLTLVSLILILLQPTIFASADKPRFSEIKRTIQKYLKRGLTLEAADHVRRLADLADGDAPKAALFISELGPALSKDHVFRAALETLTDMRNPKVEEALAKRLGRRSGPFRVRVFIAGMIGGWDSAVCQEALIGALADSNDVVVRAALEGLVNQRIKKGVQPIIDLMDRETGRHGLMWSQAKKALIELLDKELEEAGDYQSWWTAHADEWSDSILPPRKTTAHSDGKKETRARNPMFFGAEIPSDRIVFIIDVSGSMQVSDPGNESSRKRRPRTGKGGDADKPRTTSRVRIERAKAELKGALRILGKKTKFTVIAYSGIDSQGLGGRGNHGDPKEKDQFIKTWSPKLVSASKSKFKSAEKFIDKFEAKGATYTQRALEHAFEIAEADTFILLSDGAPMEFTTGGGQLTTGDILKRVTQLNRFRKVVIHTFGFEGSGNALFGFVPNAGFVEFMKDMAGQNGGSYHPIQ